MSVGAVQRVDQLGLGHGRHQRRQRGVVRCGRGDRVHGHAVEAAGTAFRYRGATGAERTRHRIGGAGHRRGHASVGGGGLRCVVAAAGSRDDRECGERCDRGRASFGEERHARSFLFRKGQRDPPWARRSRVGITKPGATFGPRSGDRDHDLVLTGGAVRERRDPIGGLGAPVARRWRAPAGVCCPAWRRPTRTATGARCRSCPAAASSASRHGPSSTRTSTRSIPRCWAQATPATSDAVRPRPCANGCGRVDPRLGLDRGLLRPAPLDPVGVEGVERRQLHLGHPLRRRDVAVQAGHDHADREPVFERERFAVHRDGEHRVAPVHHDRGRGCPTVNPSTERETSWSARGVDPCLLQQGLRAAHRPSARCRRTGRRPRSRRRSA